MTLDTPADWEAAIVEVLRDYGRPMTQEELVKIAAKICGVAPIRISYAFGLAWSEGLVVYNEKTGKVSLP